MAGIVLAAGASRRLGTPKQLARLGSETLLERSVRVALEADLHPVLVVVSMGFVMASAPAGVVSVFNEEAEEGMASSIRAGLRALESYGEPASGAVIMACDQPSVTRDHLRLLTSGDHGTLASGYLGRKGIPAYFPRTAFEALMVLSGDVGARDLLQNAASVPLLWGELDIDTPEDLKQAKKLYEI